MKLSQLIVAQLLATFAFAIALADEWSVIPTPAPAPAPDAKAPAPATDWLIGAPPTTTSPVEWLLITKPLDGSPDKDSATDGHISPHVSPGIPKPLKLACKADCACGDCQCEDCRCCSGYAAFEAALLKSGKSGILYVGTRGEDADVARKEAKVRGLLFMSAKSLSGTADDGSRESFPAGTSELKPVGADLFFVARETRRIPIPDRESSRFERVAPADCPNCHRPGRRR